MNQEILIETCIKFKTVYEKGDCDVRGCEICKTVDISKYCSKCGNKNTQYKKENDYALDIWSLTNDEIYDYHIGEYTYCFSNINIKDGGVVYDEGSPFIFESDTIEEQIKRFKEVHKSNIEKLKEYATDLEIVFIALEKWS